ncbi:hypothetical protein ACV8DN_004314 [Morganella morganii]|uniref:hypothetical protein n=1 Tax=Morganella morganii TaxID=582 RepID=UPI0029C4CA0C|nr:hypothetical protein [Morganella morganii]
MDISNVISTLIITAGSGDRYRIEINKDITNKDYFGILYVQQDIDTDKFGRRPVWCQINGYIQLGGIDIQSCERDALNKLKDQLK